MFVKFVQGEEIAKHSSDAFDNEGVCWALSMKWLAVSLAGTSDEQAGRIGQVREWVPEAIVLQRDYARLHAATDASSYENPGAVKAATFVQFFGARLGLEIDQTVKTEVMISTDASQSRLDAIVERLRTGGTGHMLSFQYPSDKGHAMATRARKSGFWHLVTNETFLFDPNGGELDMSQSTLKKFLGDHMTAHSATSLFCIKVKLRG
jgi:hypothetical protein